MRRLPLRLRLYIGAVTLFGLGLPLLALALDHPAVSAAEARLAVLLAAFAGLAYAVPVRLASKRQVLSHAALHTIAVLIFAPGMAAMLFAVPALLGNRLYLRRPWFNSAFNVAQTALTVTLAGLVYRALAPVALVNQGWSPRGALALAPAAVALYLISALIVDGATAIQSQRSPFANWWTVRAPTVMPHLMLVAIGAAIAPGVVDGPWLLLLALAPVLVIRTMLRNALGFDTSAMAVAESVATALHQRDATPAGSPLDGRLVNLVERASLTWGMADDDARRAGLVAQLSVLTTVLPGDPSTSSVHQRASAGRYIERVLRLPAVAESVRCLDERFDGHGPLGLRQQAIPIDARVVAVCTAWFELTAPQDFRAGLPVDQAMQVLNAGAGRQWDPAVVRALQRVLEAEAQSVDQAATTAWPAHHVAVVP